MKHEYWQCPSCGEEPNDDDTYKVNKVKYPIYTNYSRGFNGEFTQSSWTETHCCKKCKVEFSFQNGADC